LGAFGDGAGVRLRTEQRARERGVSQVVLGGGAQPAQVVEPGQPRLRGVGRRSSTLQFADCERYE